MSVSIRRLAALAVLIACIVSPALTRPVSAQDAATPCPPLTEEDAAALATSWVAAWNAHDADQIAALYGPDAVVHWGIGVDTEGTDAIAAAHAGFLAAFPGIHVTADQVWVAGDTVIVRYINIGVQETDFMGIPASQTTVTWTGINVMQVECGKITELWAEADHFGRIEQQGAIPMAAPEATPAA